MSKKICIKISVIFVLILSLCVGCSARHNKYTVEELDNLAKIEIFSATDNELITTVNDEELLYQFNQHLNLNSEDIEKHQKELKQDIAQLDEQYYLISYKNPVAKFGSKELEKNLTLTLYEDTNIVKMEVSQESIKSFPIPQEFLVFYYNISDEDIEFYRSLATE